MLCEQVKAVNVRARNAEVQEKLPPDLLDEVLERITLSFCINNECQPHFEIRYVNRY